MSTSCTQFECHLVLRPDVKTRVRTLNVVRARRREEGVTNPTNDPARTFRLTWLTCSPLLRGNWVAIGLGLIPGILSILSFITTLGLDESNQRVNIFAGALFFSLCATLIQLPAFLGRIELQAEILTVTNQFSGKRGRRPIPREALDEIYFTPLNRPPRTLPLGWAIVELLCVAGAVSAGSRADGGGEFWYWLTGLALGLSIWPLIAARWQAEMQVILTYQRPGEKEPGLIRAWATPHQASSLVNTLLGKIDWQVPLREGEAIGAGRQNE